MKTLVAIVCLLCTWISFGGVCGQPTVYVVSQDGTGHFTTIGAAIAASPNNSISRTIIQIKPGIYQENVHVPTSKTMLTLVGFGMDNTIVTSDRSNASGFATDKTATADISGADFVAVDITFQNTAGPLAHQAVALKSNVQSTFYRCRFFGYQDTLYTQNGRQFYRDCVVFGTVDFIFGNAAVVFQNCVIVAITPLNGQKNVITAQGRASPNEEGGTVFHNCSITGAADLPQSVHTYFGRPWRIYSRVVIMQSYIHSIIDPQGWMAWDESKPVDMLFYAEYDNRGAGADTSNRVRWPGCGILKTKDQANAYTVRNFIEGDKWIPSDIPYTLDLMSLDHLDLVSSDINCSTNLYEFLYVKLISCLITLWVVIQLID